MTIEELKSKRAKKKRMSRLITAVITLAAAIAVVAGILFYRSGLIPRDKEKAAPSADEVESVLTDGQEISGAEEAAGVNDLLGGLTPEPTPTPTPTPKPAVKTGWQKDNKGKYFLDEKGKRKTGFFTDEDGSVYYFDEDGYAVTGWQDLEDDLGGAYRMISTGTPQAQGLTALRTYAQTHVKWVNRYSIN